MGRVSYYNNINVYKSSHTKKMVTAEKHVNCLNCNQYVYSPHNPTKDINLINFCLDTRDR